MINIEKVITPEFEMKYFKFGSGKKAFVILPGLSVTSVMDAAQAVESSYSVFKDEFTTYVFDRRTELEQTYSIYDMARDTIKAIEALGLKDIYLFGASQGGMLAQVIAAESPNLVRAAVLGSTAFKVSENENITRWSALARDRKVKELCLDFTEAIYPGEMFLQYRDVFADMAKSVTDSDLDRFATLCDGTRGFDMTDELGNITCPVLVISSKDDKIFDIPDAERYGFEAYSYDGFAHAAFDTAPDYKERILDFFNRADKTESAKEYIGELFSGNADGHDYDHSVRVYQNAKKLICAYDCDREVVLLAALLHDADDRKLFNTEGYANARRFLESQGVDDEKTEAIIKVIDGVSFSKNKNKTPDTIEGKIVQDADRLDAMGAIGIARTFAYGGKNGRTLASSIQHFYDKLLLLFDGLNTERAKEISKERHEFLLAFLDEYNRETK